MKTSDEQPTGINIKELVRKHREHTIKIHGPIKGRLLLRWWKFENWIDDLRVTQFIYDLHWWITDGEAYWNDAVPCERKLCRHCGNKPKLWRRKKHTTEQK